MVLQEENMLRPVAHLPGCYNQQQGFVCLLRKQNKHKKGINDFDTCCKAVTKGQGAGKRKEEN